MTIKKAVLIATLSTIAIGLVACGLKTGAFSKSKTTTPTINKQRTAIRVDATENLTTLTGTTWLLDEYIYASPQGRSLIKTNDTQPFNETYEVYYYNDSFYQNYQEFKFGYQTGWLNIYIYGEKFQEPNEFDDFYAYPNWLSYNGHTFNRMIKFETEDNLIDANVGDMANNTLITWFVNNATLVSDSGTIVNQEVIPIMDMMWQIITMPFTFITMAFDLTLWEGTPYQFNVSNFILSLIAIASILFIIKLFTSGFSAIGNYTGSQRDKIDARKERRARTENIKANTERTKQLTKKGK